MLASVLFLLFVNIGFSLKIDVRKSSLSISGQYLLMIALMISHIGPKFMGSTSGAVVI